MPALQRLARAGVYAGREVLVPGLAKRPGLLRLVERAGLAHQRAQIADPELRRKVRPTFRLGCKRILPSAAWYPALGRPNVELVTDRIAEVRPHAIVTADGTEREIDTLILGTGFHVADMPVGEWVRGRGGTRLADAWQGSAKSYLGTVTAGFPNLFFLLGPNTGLGHSSVVYMMESQLEYVLGALRAAGDGVVEVRPEAQAAFTAEIDRRMRRHRVGERLRELVPGRDGAHPDDLARLDVALPAPDPRVRAGEVHDPPAPAPAAAPPAPVAA